MGLILKHTLKNIFHKFGRTFLLTLCIFFCSLSAVCCLDLTNGVRSIFTDAMKTYLGSTDISFNARGITVDEVSAVLPEHRLMTLYGSSETYYRRDPKLYSYAISEHMIISAFDIEKGIDMGIIGSCPALSADETALTEAAAKRLGAAEGDVIQLTDTNGNKLEFTVKAIIGAFGMITDNSCVLSVEGFEKIRPGEVEQDRVVLIDVMDDSLVSSTVIMLEDTFPEAEVMSTHDNKEMEETIESLTNTFMLIFAVCLLVVLIINISVSERIMSERLPTAGTLRSLGISRGLTTMVLLLENVVYGLMGSVPAVIAYVLLREPVINGAMGMEDDIGTIICSPSPLICMGVIVGAVLIQCACTLKECIRTGRMAIRDVIFRSSDTDFRFSKSKTLLGMICIIILAISLFFRDSFRLTVIGAFCGVIAVYLLFPYVTVCISKLLARLFDRLNMPIAHIAAVEIGAKKSTVSSTSLIAAAASITMIVLTYASSCDAVYSHLPYDCDIVLSDCDEEDFMYDYLENIDGVDRTENVYMRYDVPCEINGTPTKPVLVFGYDGNDMNKSVGELPDSLGDHEFLTDKLFAEKLGLKIGDTVDLCLECDSFFPVNMRLRLAGWCSSIYETESGRGIVISKKNYVSAFRDQPITILVRSGDPDSSALARRILDYSAEMISNAHPIDEYNAELMRQRRFEILIIRAVGFIGIFLTLAGVVSNQLIGFNARKRENAVLLSTSMNRRCLRRMLLIETAVSSGMSLIFALICGICLMLPVSRAMSMIDLAIPITINIGELIGVTAALTAVFSLTVLFPYASLHRMKLSEQLKYE